MGSQGSERGIKKNSYMLVLLACVIPALGGNFTIENNKFTKDGVPHRVLAGSTHYFRIHPDYWLDRLERVKATGLNTVSFYIPWNFHELQPGSFDFSGQRDVVRYVQLAQQAGLDVVIRPGPYICSEWDYGGIPWWVGKAEVSNNRTMQLRSNDKTFLRLVKAYWDVLLPQLAPYTYSNGGPIIAMQLENELGFFGKEKGPWAVKRYLQALRSMAREHLGDDILLFTIDAVGYLQYGTLPESDVLVTLDVCNGNGGDVMKNFMETAAEYNAPGRNAAWCSEFYTGFHPKWNDIMHQTNAELMIEQFNQILDVNDGYGSVSLYMYAGGTNFGFWAGGAGDGYPITTTYDSGYPLSEAGDYCQPGLGGPCKIEMIREAIANHTGVPAPELPPRPTYKAYGPLQLAHVGNLLDMVDAGMFGEGYASIEPQVAEEYGMRAGMILYRTVLPTSVLDANGSAVLNLTDTVRNYGQVFMGGELAVNYVNRSSDNDKLMSSVELTPRSEQLTPQFEAPDGARLDFLVQAMGRGYFFGSNYELKGIVKDEILANGQPLSPWRAYPMGLETLPPEIDFAALPPEAVTSGPQAPGQPLAWGAAFYRGVLTIPEGSERPNKGFLPDTYLQTFGWTKGIAWVNGFCLGWYWPIRGPQYTLYIPGPLLKEGDNEILMLELYGAKADESVSFEDVMDWGYIGGPPPTTQNMGTLESGSLPGVLPGTRLDPGTEKEASD